MMASLFQKDLLFEIALSEHLPGEDKDSSYDDDDLGPAPAPVFDLEKIVPQARDAWVQVRYV